MTIELYDRRKMMLDLHYSGVRDASIIRDVATTYNASHNAVRMDWYRRGTWEPLIWRMETSKVDAERLLYHFKLGRERAISLMRTADNDNAKVGAIGKLIELVTKEIELRQSLGVLHKVADKLEVKQDVTHHREKVDIERYSEDEREALRNVARLMERNARELPSEDGEG